MTENKGKRVIDEMNCLVSVVIPTHNGAEFLSRAIKSALNQTYPEVEVIVVDDNGYGTEMQQETQAIINEFSSYKNLKYITYEKNVNASYARNVGIKNSTGKYIALLDDDDEMYPDKIKLQVECLEQKDDSYVACYTDYEISRGAYKETSKEKLEGQPFFEALCRNLFICGGSNLFVRKDAIEGIGGFDESFKRNQDIELLTRLLKNNKIAHVNDCQLIIHMEDRGDRKKTFSYQRNIEIDDFYLAKFSEDIKNLNKKDRELLYKYFALERFKRSIGTENLVDGFKNLSINKVGLILLIRYIYYLVHRKKTKTIYGFRMKRE